MKIKRKKIHFVGIGGSGMSGIAEVLSTMGHIISGSDLAESQTTERLKSLGIEINFTHSGEHVIGKDIVVYSSAVDKINPELIKARELKIPILKRGDMLAELMAFKQGIAIAGTHGKTTTTSILASIFHEAGLDPTVVIGGKFTNLNSNARLGKGDFLIAEVDESDRSFLKTLPTVAAITNVDIDHIRMFGEKNNSYDCFDDIINAFKEFIYKIPLLGKIVLNKDDNVLLKISSEHIRDYIFFSLNDKNADFYASNISFKEQHSYFDLYQSGTKIDRLHIKLLGSHNVMNTIAAISIAQSLGLSFEKIKLGLENFSGIERRLEFIVNKKNKKIIVDYCHHPTEIKCTLQSLKEAFPSFKVITLFQPHRYSRTEHLFDDFTKSFSNSDSTYITDIYQASETETKNVSGALLAEKTPNAIYLPSIENFIPELKELINKDKTILLFAGAGNIYKYANYFI